jgi:hypothetical protein
MKFVKSTLAVALAASMGSAFAATPIASPEVTLYMSGATALNGTIKNMVASYCAVGTNPQVYRYNGDVNFSAYECSLDNVNDAGQDPYDLLSAATTPLNGKTMRVYHTTKVNAELGGSILGVMPIYRNIDMEYVRPEAGCTAAGTEVVNIASGSVTFDLWNCTLKDVHGSEVGVSDVSPDVFEGLNLSTATLSTEPPVDTNAEVLAWSSNISAVEKASVNYKPALAVGFGIAATNTLAAAGVTSLTTDQVANLLAGQYDLWSQVDPSNANLAGYIPVKVCRRTAGSGTQASYNAFFNNAPCGNVNGTAMPVADMSSTGTFGLLTVVENSASSDVRTCLDAANAAGELAIGNLTMEGVPSGTAGWTFIGLNGINAYDPTETLATSNDGEADKIREELIAQSQWPFYEEATMQWRNSLADLPGNPKLSLANLLRDNASNPLIANGLRAVLAVASTWSNPAYPDLQSDADFNGFADQREYPAVMATGVMEYTRNGNACNKSYYQP